MDDPKTLLLLNGVVHRLSTVLANAKLAPHVQIDVTDIHPLPHCGGPADSLVEFRPASGEPGETQEIVFYKQNGGYTILLGRKKFEASLHRPVSEEEARAKAKKPTVVRGRLLSTPVLKKCRVENEPRPEQLDPIRTLDRGARTAYADNSYQGNRIEVPTRTPQQEALRILNAAAERRAA